MLDGIMHLNQNSTLFIYLAITDHQKKQDTFVNLYKSLSSYPHASTAWVHFIMN